MPTIRASTARTGNKALTIVHDVHPIRTRAGLYVCTAFFMGSAHSRHVLAEEIGVRCCVCGGGVLYAYRTNNGDTPWVDARYRSQGLGSELVRAAEATAKEKGYMRLQEPLFVCEWR